MELTIDQALQEGVAAHKEGKLQDAERLYRAILQAQPNHPDANHNLGVLAVAVGKPIEAIPLFKFALDANPQIEQFWLSYIDALLKAGQLDEAAKALAEGEQAGTSREKLNVLRKQIQRAFPTDDKTFNNSLSAADKRKRLTEKKKSKKKKQQDKLSVEEPSQDQLNRP